MSKSLLRKFLVFSKDLFVEESNKHNTTEFCLRLGFATTILVGHGIYTFSTEKNDAIIVTKKYKMNRNGYTDFMVVDDKGRHFNVNNSLWFWKWDSIEDWHKIVENQQLFIKYYGWRIPVLGFFPNIVLSNKAQFLDRMSRAKFCRFEAENLL